MGRRQCWLPWSLLAALRATLGLLLALALAACGSLKFPGAYQIVVEQGNIVTEDMLSELKPGMTRQQVRYVLGTPLVEDPFNNDRWDYVYMRRRGTNLITERRLTIFFDDDELSRFTRSVEPMGDRAVVNFGAGDEGDVAEDGDAAEGGPETSGAGDGDTAEDEETAAESEDAAGDGGTAEDEAAAQP